MQKLLNGERTATPLQVILAVGILLGCLAIGLFAYSARSTAIDSQRIAQAATASENDLRATIVARCQSRVQYDQRFVEKSKSDAATWAALLKILNAAPLPDNVDPETRALITQERAVLTKAHNDAQKIVDQGVIGNCDAYTKDK